VVGSRARSDRDSAASNEPLQHRESRERWPRRNSYAPSPT